MRLLFDAGISGVQAEKRLAMHGRDIRDVDALIISHDHSDHIKCAGVYSRKYGHTVHVSKRTYQAASNSMALGHIAELKHFAPGDSLDFGTLRVETVPTAHDATDGAAFVVDTGTERLGILTDLGHAFHELSGVIASLDAVFLESNYDPQMLEDGPYPPFVKQRVRGRGGHLSNQECATLLKDYGGGLKWACLSHMSENNNTPELAIKCHRETLGSRLPLYTASRSECSDVFTL